jgi:hypothetical protein
VSAYILRFNIKFAASCSLPLAVCRVEGCASLSLPLSLYLPLFSNTEGRKSVRRRTSEEDAGGFWAGFCGEVTGAETRVGCVRVCE